MNGIVKFCAKDKSSLVVMVIFFEAIMQFSLLLINYQQVKIVAISKYSIPGMKYLSILCLLPRSPYGSNLSFRKRVPKLEKKIPTQGKNPQVGKRSGAGGSRTLVQSAHP